MIDLIISGGQTGADRAGLDAAISKDVPHTGWCPYGRRAEDGEVPGHYRLFETASPSYLVRNEKNVLISDGTLVFTLGELTSGSRCTVAYCEEHGKPWFHISLNGLSDEEAVMLARSFISAHGIRRLNIAGTTGSRAPGLYERVLAVMSRVLQEDQPDCGEAPEEGRSARVTRRMAVEIDRPETAGEFLTRCLRRLADEFLAFAVIR